MIASMTRYDFILLSGGTEEFLGKLQELGVVDITRSVKAIDDKSAEMLGRADELKKRIAWLSKENFIQDPAYAALVAEIAEAKAQRSLREPWGRFDIKALKALEEAGCKLDFHCVPAKKFDSDWASKWPLEVIENDGVHVWFVTSGLSEEGEAFPVAAIAAPDGTVEDSDALIASLEEKLARRADELRAEDIPALQKELDSLKADVDFYLASVATDSAAEGALTVITGFAPSEEKQRLTEVFDESDVFYMSSDASVEDNPPIKLKNNKFVRMFEVLTDMYGRPAYNGFDPTPYISIFFLLFFAMCMGDAGYGLILILIGWLLRKVKSFASLSPLVMTLGAGTLVVGFLFHTFFSVDISGWTCIPDALKSVMVPSKIATYDGTMVLALIIGIIHLCLAMIVKTVYATKNQGFLESLGTWGWTLLIVGGVVVGVIALAGVIDSNVTKIVIIALGCVSALGIFFLNNLHRNPLLNVGSGLWEAYNTATGLLGDVLSYLRLYALGLAGGMLGFAFNDLAKMALGDGGIGWIFFILIVLIGHALNIAMAVLGAFVHPLRLNFLEFFKNSAYEGVGRKYNPLKKNN